jgi:hypothetical protein
MASLHVILQYVNDARPERQAEYDQCLRRNLENPHVQLVHNLLDENVTVPDVFARHPRFRQHALGHWITFADAFAFANTHLPGEACALMNLDIFLDDRSDWHEAVKLLDQKLVWCLSRTEFGAENTATSSLVMEAGANSQDAWVFRAPIEVQNCNFGVGTLGCDNAIAHRIKESGLLPINAATRFRIYHIDRFRRRTPQNQHEIYHSERHSRGQSTHPEREGQYLLPDFDMLKSADELMRILRLNDVQRYSVICDILNRFVKVRNP